MKRLEGAEPVPKSFATGTKTRSDSTAAFTMFFEAEFPSVVRTAYLILHDGQQAEEIAQEAFVRLYTRWTKVAAYQRPDAWVRRVAIHMAMRASSRDYRRRDLEQGVAPPAVTKPRDLDVLRAVRALPPQQRAAVALFYFEDRPIEEIAHLLDCSESTARVHLMKARQRLGDLLGEEVHDADEA